jgi:hypothetical protein
MKQSEKPAGRRASQITGSNSASLIISEGQPPTPHADREQKAYERWRRDLRSSLVALSVRAADRPDVQNACDVLIGFIEAPE